MSLTQTTVPYAEWLVWLLPLVGSLIVPAIFRLSKKAGEAYSVSLTFVSAAIALSMVLDVWGGKRIEISVPWIPIGERSIEAGVIVDPLSVLMASIATGIGALIILYSVGYMSHEGGLARYYFFMLLFIGGMTGLVMSNNFLQLYIFWEIVGLCSYALIGFYTRREQATHAGIKAFVTTRVGDVMMLVGIIMIFNMFGSFSYTSVSNEIVKGLETGTISYSTLFLILVLIFGGAVGKSAQFPLHEWLPDAMEGPTPVSALIHAATMVKAGVYLVARLTVTVIPISEPGFAVPKAWFDLVALLGGITALIAASMALASNDIKRVIAYSTMSQLGLMFSALGLANVIGWFASQFHLISHAVFKALLFLSAGSVIHAVGTTDMEKMGGLARYMPITFFSGLIGALSLSGIPPLSGFFSKDVLIEAAIKSGNYPVYLILLFTSVMTVSYSFRWIYKVFLAPPKLETHVHEAPWSMRCPLIILTGLTAVVGLLEPALVSFSGIDVHISISSLTYISSMSIILAGLTPFVIVYWRRIIPPETITSSKMGSIIGNLLVNRYYIDRAYYKVFANGTVWISNKLKVYAEDKGIDRFNYVLANVVKSFVDVFRNIQTGQSNINVSGFIVGLLILLIIFLGLILGG